MGRMFSPLGAQEIILAISLLLLNSPLISHGISPFIKLFTIIQEF